ncbi:MAG: transglutaminase family protein [Albidovulum sp.]
MQLHINHTTQYSYDQPVDYALQKVRMRPNKSLAQDITDWALRVEGGKVEASYCDHYGNHTDLISINPGERAVKLIASGNVVTRDQLGVFGMVYGRAPLWHFSQDTKLTKPGPQIKELAKVVDAADNTLAGLHDLSDALLKAAPYEIGKTDSHTNAEHALELGNAVCQDHAHIFISAARLARIPARYVSGYLMMDDRVDQAASHAWAEAHVEALGWVGFDVSNGVAPDERYVRIAIGRDALDAAPVTGMRLGNSSESMIVSLQVEQ